MSRAGIAIAALFLGLALFQGARAVFPSDPAAPPPDSVASTTPSPSLEASPAESPKLEPFPTFAGRPPQPKSYPTTEDLAAELTAKGIDCSQLSFLDQPDPTLAEFSLCDPGTAERRFNIYFYETPENRRLWVGYMKEQKLPLPLLWGPNWIVVAGGEPSTARARIRSIRGVLGGTIEDFSPKDQ